MNSKQVGEKIKQARKNAKLSQKDFAKALCVSERHLRALENGEHNVGINTLSYYILKIKELLGVDIWLELSKFKIK